MKEDNFSRRIQILREDVARKIAAGEVIDRPFSVVRELIDNSIDAGSKNIDVYIREGGMEEIRVVDDGIGMSVEDLELCYLSHATSKISNVDDIYRVKSLGFRGEALSSIATCSKLEIVSKRENDKSAHRLVVEGGKLISLEEASGKRGTVVSVSKLFFNMPARKAFLKSTSSETSMCRSSFVEKSLPFPEISFRFFIDGTMKDFLPEATLAERVALAYRQFLRPELLFSLEKAFDDMNFRIIGGEPSLARRDRRLLQVFVNGRRVNEYSLLKTIEWAYSRHVPGGYFPVCFVFIELEPSMADFNIHPAKREVRIRNINLVKNRLTVLIGDELSTRKRRPAVEGGNAGSGEEALFGGTRNILPRMAGYRPSSQGKVGGGGWKESIYISRHVEGEKNGADERDREDVAERSFTYLGQVFGVFLAVQYGEHFYLIDQHAAHERIIFDELMSKEYSAQELLFPIHIVAEEEEVKAMEERLKDIEELGIVMEKVSEREYDITAMPEDLLLLDEKEIVGFIKEARGSRDEVKREIMDTVACRMAVKEGDPLDPVTAVELIEKTFGLDDARCPHGRPVWFSISREELYRQVMRR